jgi:hypothetical protein
VALPTLLPAHLVVVDRQRGGVTAVADRLSLPLVRRLAQSRHVLRQLGVGGVWEGGAFLLHFFQERKMLVVGKAAVRETRRGCVVSLSRATLHTR